MRRVGTYTKEVPCQYSHVQSKALKKDTNPRDEHTEEMSVFLSLVALMIVS